MVYVGDLLGVCLVGGGDVGVDDFGVWVEFSCGEVFVYVGEFGGWWDGVGWVGVLFLWFECEGGVGGGL